MFGGVETCAKGKFTLKTLKQTNKMTLSWGVVTSQPGGGEGAVSKNITGRCML